MSREKGKNNKTHTYTETMKIEYQYNGFSKDIHT